MKKVVLSMIFTLLVLLPAGAQAVTAGTLDYNPTSGRMQFYDGVQWYSFGIGLPGGACTTPGQMDYDTLLSTYKTCNGSVWTYVAGIPTLSVCTKEAEMEYTASSFYYCNGLLWVNMKGLVATS